MRALLFLLVASLLGCATTSDTSARRNPAEAGLQFKVLSVDVVQLSAPPKSEVHKWYVEKLGISPNKYGSDEWQQFDIPGSSAFAINYSEDEPALLKQRFTVSFKVSDIKAAVKSMQSQGVKFLNVDNPIRESFWGYRATFQDPQGIYLQILEDK